MRARQDQEGLATQETIIGPSLKIKGDLHSEGDIRIEGEVQGSVKTAGTVSIGSEAKVSATIEASNADVAGRVDGDISVQHKISLASSARVKGNLTSSELVIAQGAQFTGSSAMSSQDQVSIGTRVEPSLRELRVKEDATL